MGIPAQDAALAVSEIIDLLKKLVRRQDHLPALLAEILRQMGQNLLYLLNGECEVLAAASQGLEQVLILQFQ